MFSLCPHVQVFSGAEVSRDSQLSPRPHGAARPLAAAACARFLSTKRTHTHKHNTHTLLPTLLHSAVPSPGDREGFLPRGRVAQQRDGARRPRGGLRSERRTLRRHRAPRPLLPHNTRSYLCTGIPPMCARHVRDDTAARDASEVYGRLPPRNLTREVRTRPSTPSAPLSPQTPKPPLACAGGGGGRGTPRRTGALLPRDAGHRGKHHTAAQSYPTPPFLSSPADQYEREDTTR